MKINKTSCKWKELHSLYPPIHKCHCNRTPQKPTKHQPNKTATKEVFQKYTLIRVTQLSTSFKLSELMQCDIYFVFSTEKSATSIWDFNLTIWFIEENAYFHRQPISMLEFYDKTIN